MSTTSVSSEVTAEDTYANYADVSAGLNRPIFFPSTSIEIDRFIIAMEYVAAAIYLLFRISSSDHIFAVFSDSLNKDMMTNTSTDSCTKPLPCVHSPQPRR
jgi:hypothetical protein